MGCLSQRKEKIQVRTPEQHVETLQILHDKIIINELFIKDST